MINIAVIGLGKIGISHLSILNRHKDINILMVCDTSDFVLGGLKRYTSFKCIKNFKKINSKSGVDAVIIATPTILHYDLVKYFLNENIHVFVEKPFCTLPDKSIELVELAKEKKLINQVGYHNRMIATFSYVKELIEAGTLGDIYYFSGESYGPAVTKKSKSSWKSNKSLGGGCLYDYASHVINLINFFFGEPETVKGTVLKNIFSEDVEDAVYSTFIYPNNLSGNLIVNWSDPSFRRMSTKITIFGKKGKIIVDSQECRIYLTKKDENWKLYKGWNTKYITDLSKHVNFLVRSEEYTLQMDYFVECIQTNNYENNINSFTNAAITDNVINKIIMDNN